jgi:hypothetical protein
MVTKELEIISTCPLIVVIVTIVHCFASSCLSLSPSAIPVDPCLFLFHFIFLIISSSFVFPLGWVISLYQNSFDCAWGGRGCGVSIFL